MALTQQKRPAFWRNATVLKWAAQIAVLVGLVFLFITLGAQSLDNFAARGLSYSYNFLQDPTGVAFREGIPLEPDTGARALYVGLVNTLRITVSGIIVATLLGTIVGVARLSSNWIINKISTVYIESHSQHSASGSDHFLGSDDPAAKSLRRHPHRHIRRSGFTSAKGITIPWLFPDNGFYQWLVFVIGGFITARFVYQWRMRVKEERRQGDLRDQLGSWNDCPFQPDRLVCPSDLHLPGPGCRCNW